jgi:hypothetical protein
MDLAHLAVLQVRVHEQLGADPERAQVTTVGNPREAICTNGECLTRKLLLC